MCEGLRYPEFKDHPGLELRRLFIYMAPCCYFRDRKTNTHTHTLCGVSLQAPEGPRALRSEEKEFFCQYWESAKAFSCPWPPALLGFIWTVDHSREDPSFQAPVPVSRHSAAPPHTHTLQCVIKETIKAEGWKWLTFLRHMVIRCIWGSCENCLFLPALILDFPFWGGGVYTLFSIGLSSGLSSIPKLTRGKCSILLGE